MSAFQLTSLDKVNVDTQAGTVKEGTGTPQGAATFAGMVIDYQAGSANRGHGHYLIPDSAGKAAPIQSSRVRLEQAP